ncbi:MAG: hypothetical protein HY270_00595 [Deltaproteobacteria bacterium]|nr:hypothetical protein [Deltaproteobacteria bacterium]
MADQTTNPAPPEPLDSDRFIDRFYRGAIVKLRRGTRTGIIRSATTRRDIPFDFQHVRFVGTKQRFEDLRENMAVGYDVSWTAKGLCVSVIFIPE